VPETPSNGATNVPAPILSDDDLRAVVATGCRVLGHQGHGDLVWGHVSARDPDGRGIWMKASTFGFEEVTPDRVLLLDGVGNVLSGEGRPHAEYPIHTEVVSARPDVGAVVHTHPPNAVAFAALDVPLRPLSHEGTLFVPPDIRRFELTGDLILTPELGRALADELGERNVVLLVDHGIVTVGPDVPTAVVTAILLERACRMQLRAMAAGELRRWSDDDEALTKRAHCYSPALLRQAWEYLVRRVDA
jgi:L-ribulose-5-phosphate 4-epimerase